MAFLYFPFSHRAFLTRESVERANRKLRATQLPLGSFPASARRADELFRIEPPGKVNKCQINKKKKKELRRGNKRHATTTTLPF